MSSLTIDWVKINTKQVANNKNTQIDFMQPLNVLSTATQSKSYKN